MKQIFLRGISRSGGTLMVTVLDAHPEIAMCYELYEHLLTPTDEGVDRLNDLRNRLGGAQPWWKKWSRRAAPPLQDRKLDTFVKWSLRGGIELPRLRELLEQHAGAGFSFSTFRDRVRFIEAIAMEKMTREGKRHWGAKMIKGYHELHQIFPEAYFLFMQRDGRDVAASRKLVGDFKQSMETVATGWCRQIRRFRKFAAQPGVRARLVDYESLATDPEPQLREVMNFLGLPWD